MVEVSLCGLIYEKYIISSSKHLVRPKGGHKGINPYKVRFNTRENKYTKT